MDTSYLDWDMVVDDTTIEGVTPKDVRQQLAALKPGSYKNFLMWAHIPTNVNYDVLNNNPAAELQSWKVIMTYLIEKRTDAEN